MRAGRLTDRTGFLTDQKLPCSAWGADLPETSSTTALCQNPDVQNHEITNCWAGNEFHKPNCENLLSSLSFTISYILWKKKLTEVKCFSATSFQDCFHRIRPAYVEQFVTVVTYHTVMPKRSQCGEGLKKAQPHFKWHVPLLCLGLSAEGESDFALCIQWTRSWEANYHQHLFLHNKIVCSPRVRLLTGIWASQIINNMQPFS